jgi:diguanylate cyclase (GGDEF)-like protein
LDIDGFRSYNDEFGHEVGDRALIRVAEVLRESDRADDITARYGAEEFVLLLNDTPEEAA